MTRDNWWDRTRRAVPIVLAVLLTLATAVSASADAYWERLR